MVDNFCLIPSRLQKQFQSSDTNFGPQSEMSIRDESCRNHTCRMNSLAHSRVSVSFLQEIKCLILVSLSTTTSIEIHPFDHDTSVTKSIDMSFQCRCGIGKGLSTLNGACPAVCGLLKL